MKSVTNHSWQNVRIHRLAAFAAWWPWLVLLAVVVAPICNTASAETIAYWRFEEGPVDTQAAVYQSDWFLDSTDNGNHMWTWADFTVPTYRADVPFDPVPQTGAANGLSLEFNPNQDNYTSGKPINSHVFDELTVEASVKLDRLDLWQVMVGKDGKPTDEPFPPFMFKAQHIDAGGKLEAGLLDGDGIFRSILSNDVPDIGQWYDLAVTNDGATMRFFIKGPNDLDYVEQGAGIAVSGGALIDSVGDWTVGRGMWDGWIADWSDSSIDEVRISDVALDPSELLGVPEPSTFGLAGLGLLILAAVARRRRRA